MAFKRLKENKQYNIDHHCTTHRLLSVCVFVFFNFFLQSLDQLVNEIERRKERVVCSLTIHLAHHLVLDNLPARGSSSSRNVVYTYVLCSQQLADILFYIARGLICRFSDYDVSSAQLVSFWKPYTSQSIRTCLSLHSCLAWLFPLPL